MGSGAPRAATDKRGPRKGDRRLGRKHAHAPTCRPNYRRKRVAQIAHVGRAATPQPMEVAVLAGRVLRGPGESNRRPRRRSDGLGVHSPARPAAGAGAPLTGYRGSEWVPRRGSLLGGATGRRRGTGVERVTPP